MKQLSRRRRSAYLIVMIIVFFVTIPIIILYSMGYRLNDALALVTTGGISIHSTEGNVNVYVNGKLDENTGIFSRNIFISSLRPRVYTVALQKDGFQPWVKVVRVYPNEVSEFYSFSAPTVYPIVPVSPSLASSTLPNPEYAEALAIFAATSTPIATSSIPVTADDSNGDLLLKQNLRYVRGLLTWIDNGQIIASWKGPTDASPYYFCDAGFCKDRITTSFSSPISYYDFYPGRNDVVVIATPQGIFDMELDTRSAPNVYSVMSGANLTFRIASDNVMYIKDASSTIYSVSLE